MKILQKRFFLTITALLFVVSILISSTPKIISYKSQQDFEKGKAEGVSITSQGEVRLAPKVEELYQSEMPFIWSCGSDKSGNVYVAGGSEGEIFKIDAEKNATVFFDVGKKQIYAMTVDKHNNLFVSTSPEGKVYKIPRNGNVSLKEAEYFDPDDLYIWSLLVDNSDNLYVATGEKGNIYKVDSKGNSSLFYDSEDIHIRKIIFDNEGNIIAGTSNKAMIIKIDKQGQAFVLYDSPLVEITDLTVDTDGNIFAAAAGEARIQRTTRRTSTGTSEQDDDDDNSDNDENVMELPTQTITASGAARVSTQKSELYKIGADGTVKTFWTSNSLQIYSVILDDSDNIILGTGDPGRIYSLDAFGEHTLLTEFDEQQITSLGEDARGELLVCTSNPGKAYRLHSNFREHGEYLSEVIDASVSSQWGSMSWEADVGGNGELAFYTRTGNTEEPDKTWSPWSEPLTNSKGQRIQSPPARFIQFKARLSSENGKQTPVLREVVCSYLQKNIAPEIRGIRIHEPGEYYPESTQNVSTDSHLGNDGTSNSNGSQNNHPGRKTVRKGGRSVSWQAKDENGDNLAFNVYYKGTDEQNWKTLVKDLHGVVYSWDSELFPDGRYVIKVVAKDGPSNPPAMSLSSEKISQPFEVDNTGPQVSDIDVKTQKNKATISFVVEDEMTNIRSVYYGLNAEDWKLVYPTDGICDSKSETFGITTDALVPGSNTIVIKAVDTIGNIGFGKTQVSF